MNALFQGHPLNDNGRLCIILFHGAGDGRDGEYHSEPCSIGWPGYACETGSGSQVVPVRYSMCRAWGDPHVVTFDGANNDVYGIATYIMAQNSQLENGSLTGNGTQDFGTDF